MAMQAPRGRCPCPPGLAMGRLCPRPRLPALLQGSAPWSAEQPSLLHPPPPPPGPPPGPWHSGAACGEAPWAERARRAKLARQGCRCISPDGDCRKPSRGVGVSGLGETGFKAMTDARPRGGGASACRCARSRGAMVVFGPSMGCTGSCAPRLV